MNHVRDCMVNTSNCPDLFLTLSTTNVLAVFYWLCLLFPVLFRSRHQAQRYLHQVLPQLRLHVSSAFHTYV